MNTSDGMPAAWRVLTQLLQFSLHPEAGKPEVSPEVPWQEVFELARFHSLTSTVAPVVRSLGCPEEIAGEFLRVYARNVRRLRLFDEARTDVEKAMAQAGISLVPLKGLLLCDYYPQREMREFADYDYWVDPSRQKDARKIMKRLGFDVNAGEVHDVCTRAPFLNFELHHTLFVSEAPYASFFENAWVRRGKTAQGERLSEDDFYLHVLAHLYKHSSRRGTGLRGFCDWWLLERERTRRGLPLPETAIQSLGLESFYEQVSGIAEEMMTAPECLTASELEPWMESGTYGSETNFLVKEMAEQGRWTYVRKRLFPPYAEMKKRFPHLRYVPFLFPLTWPLRWILALFRPGSRRYFCLLMRTAREPLPEKDGLSVAGAETKKEKTES